MRNTKATQLIFELSKSGRRAMRLPQSDVPTVAVDELIPDAMRADTPPPLPEVAEAGSGSPLYESFDAQHVR